MDGIDHAVNGQAGGFRGGEGFHLVLAAGGVEFHAVVADLLEDAEFLLEIRPEVRHAAFQRELDWQRSCCVLGAEGKRGGSGGEGREEMAALHE